MHITRLWECCYYQNENEVRSSFEISDRLDAQLKEEGKGQAFTGEKEYEQKSAQRRHERIRRERGTFYLLEKIDIPCISIEEEQNNCYRIKWFDNGCGMPRRRGGNEDFGKKGHKLAGQPNVLNETAFILEEGKAGVLKYNYRCSYYDGQWYKCYYVYVVNEKVLTQEIFLRDYDYEYNQLADLF